MSDFFWGEKNEKTHIRENRKNVPDNLYFSFRISYGTPTPRSCWEFLQLKYKSLGNVPDNSQLVKEIKREK